MHLDLLPDFLPRAFPLCYRFTSSFYWCAVRVLPHL